MLVNLSVFVQVLVRDHRDKPLNRVQVRLVEQQLFRQGREGVLMSCTDRASSQSDGIAVFICNTPRDGVRAVLKVWRGRLFWFIGVSAAVTFSTFSLCLLLTCF